MDNTKTGLIIRTLRKERHMTQLQLAEMLHVSDKAVSKWERGLGCPEISLISDIARIFGVDAQTLLSGELSRAKLHNGNMKTMKFYICPYCGNIVTAAADASVSCCGRRLMAEDLKKASEGERLNAEIIENEYFITSDHEMTREHCIGFVALITADTVILKKLYPEWDMQLRMPMLKRGRLVWHCSRHGLYYQDL